MVKKRETKSKKSEKVQDEEDPVLDATDDVSDEDEAVDDVVEEDAPVLTAHRAAKPKTHVFAGETLKGVNVGDTIAPESNPGAAIVVTADNLDDLKFRKIVE